MLHRLFTSALLVTHVSAISYPAARKVEVTDTYHGTIVADPYRWLEDDNAAETKAWVKAQNEVTEKFLATISRREAIRKRLAELWNYERIGAPTRRGDHWFYSYNSGLQNQSALMVSNSENGTGRVLIDPNTFSKDGTVSLSGSRATEDGALLAYSISTAGSDWEEIRVRDVATGKDREDHLKWVKFSSISWRKDGGGFYYSRYDAPAEGQALTRRNEFHKLCFHKLGTPQEEDAIVWQDKEHATRNFGGGVTEDGQFLIIYASEGGEPKNRVFYKDLSAPDTPVIKLLDKADASYGFLGNDGGVFYFQTDLDAPRGRIIAIDIHKPDPMDWKTLVPQTKDTLTDVSLTGNVFFCEYLQDAKSAVFMHALDGKMIREIKLPGLGSTGGFGGKRTDEKTFFTYTSFTEPGATYQLDVKSGEYQLWRKSEVKFDTAPYETRQVFVTSKDGTRVPMFITCRKDVKLDGGNPALLYGYGGFEISQTPGFSIGRAVWLEMGGVLAVANLRGGGEYGRDWHLAGTKLKKQNTFDDFISCAEWLQKNGYTSKEKLAIQGGSNGGLLVGACMTQRPELFAAALPAVGVMDMLRFPIFTIGWAWKQDYGSPDDPAEFKALFSYSPYHNLKPGVRYPSTLVTTADHDDRVVPAHSFKFAARLQECQATDGPPVLIRVETSAGHGAGTALNKMIESTADQWAFLTKALGMEGTSNTQNQQSSHRVKVN